MFGAGGGNLGETPPRFIAMREAGSHRPSPLGAASASATFPGWGQLRVGRRKMGLALMAATALFLAASMVAVVDVGALGVVGWLVDPGFLLAVVLADLMLAVVRVWATTHAWLTAGGRLASTTLIIVVLLVSVPHIALGYFGMHTRSSLMSIFPTPPRQAPALAGESTTTSAAPTTSAPTSTGLYRTQVPPMSIPTSSTPVTATTMAIPLGDERFTVLLLGGDAGPGRRGLRTDTMIVASIDTLSGDAVLFGLPRNMGGFIFSDGTLFPGLGRGLLNEVYEWGLRNPGRFGGVDPGASAVSDVASTLLGIQVDHFVLADMGGFARIVDVLGGVTVEVGRNMVAPLYDATSGEHTMITIEQGTQRLDGRHALAYARSRTGSNDYERMSRQRCLLTALGEQLEPLSLFARFPAVLDAIGSSVTTDIPLSKIPYIVNLAPKISSDRVMVVGFDRGFRHGRTANGLSKPDVKAIQAAVQLAMAGEAPEGSGLAEAANVCS